MAFSFTSDTIACFTAVKAKNMNQIAVFDAMKHVEGGHFVQFGSEKPVEYKTIDGGCDGSKAIQFNFARDIIPGKFQVRMNSSKQ